jgi:ADP-ribosylglycohydrolase
MTSLALCFADSLIACDGLDQRDLMERFVRWWRKGENSPTGYCVDIGITTRAALQRYRRTGNPVAGSIGPKTASNGSIMRLAPVALRWQGQPDQAIAAARAQSVTTHRHPAAVVEGCALLAEILVDANIVRDQQPHRRAAEAGFKQKLGCHGHLAGILNLASGSKKPAPDDRSGLQQLVLVAGTRNHRQFTISVAI